MRLILVERPHPGQFSLLISSKISWFHVMAKAQGTGDPQPSGRLIAAAVLVSSVPNRFFEPCLPETKQVGSLAKMCGSSTVVQPDLYVHITAT